MRRLVFALTLTVTGRLAAQDVNRVDVHGFGTWMYSQTSNANSYLSGRTDGDYGYVFAGLNINATVDRQIHIVVQPAWHIDGTGQPTQIDLNLAFIEWQLSDAFRLRAGEVKNPFGLYTEVYDIGTVRPFLSLPQTVYGPQGIVARAYKGVGLTGTKDLGASWNVSYDAYFGEFDIPQEAAPLDFFTTTDALGGVELLPTKTTVGGRVVMHTPVDGLSFGTTAYTGRLTSASTVDTVHRRRSIVAGQAEYLTDKWSARGEFVWGQGKLGEGPDMTVHSGYAEVAYHLTPHWQLAGLYEREQVHMSGVNVSVAPSLLRHEDFEPGVNYWISPNVVIKLSDHFVYGNRFSMPDPSLVRQVVAAGQLRSYTNDLQFGTQFSF